MNEEINNKVTTIGHFYQFKCPQCNEIVEVEQNQVNCCIFRHGIFEVNGSQQQIPPHSSKQQCDKFVEDGLLEGCGKPFRFVFGSPNYVEKCDYI